MQTLDGSVRHESVIKRSRFRALAERCDTVAEAAAFIERVRDAGATHNCWAYRIGVDYRFSDDGEPAGTAGRPILAAIDGAGLDHVAVVVTRYYGGIKLGAGGLARAYGGGASRCLEQAPVVTVRPRCEVEVTVAFDEVGAVYPLLEPFGAERLAEDYAETGVTLRIGLEARRLDGFRDALADATRGEAQLRVTSTPGSDAA